jgi:hypothetical protein
MLFNQQQSTLTKPLPEAQCQIYAAKQSFDDMILDLSLLQ